MRFSFGLATRADIHDCDCGLRYLRHVAADDHAHSGVVLCSCGRFLEHWHGFYWIDYEPEEPSYQLN